MAAIDLAKAKGLKRVGELLTGSRVRKLEARATHLHDRSNAVADTAWRHMSKDRPQEPGEAALDHALRRRTAQARADTAVGRADDAAAVARKAPKNEQKKVTLTRGAAAATLGGATLLEHEARKKKTASLPYASLFDELAKLGAVSPEQAQSALAQLDRLEANKPTAGQMGRYATVGALAGPAVGALSNAIEGKELFGPNPLRGIAAGAVKGAVSAGAVPLLNRALDQHAQKRTLRNFVQQE